MLWSSNKHHAWKGATGNSLLTEYTEWGEVTGFKNSDSYLTTFKEKLNGKHLLANFKGTCSR